MGGMAISAFTLLFAPLSVAPQVPYYMAEFNRSLPDVIDFVSSISSLSKIPRIYSPDDNHLYLDWSDNSSFGLLKYHLGSNG